MPEQELTIIDFVSHPQLLALNSLSIAQRTCLKATYGLPLDETELEIYRRANGRETYDEREQTEATFIAGRRSGKSSRIAAPIACYEACRNHKLSRGERGYVMLIAPVTKQAQIDFRFIRDYILGSSILRRKVLKVRRSEIDLKNGITIACCACSYITVRGASVVAAICDEMAFWRHEETAANPEEEVLDALRPAMATFPCPKLIKISSPYRKDGILWREFQQRAELDYPVWQLSTFEMNPMIQTSSLERERLRNQEKFRREYLAEFTENIASWVEPEVLEACIVRGRTELPPVLDAVYVAAVDPAFQRNDFALAILHRLPDGTIVVDRVARWAGTKKAPLGYEWVCGEIARIVRQYGVNVVVGDQYCAAVIRQHMLTLDINYENFCFGTHTRADLFCNLKHLLAQHKIELLDDPELLRELRSLEEQKTDRGQIDVRPSGGMKDDLAVAVALAASQLAKRPSAPPPFLLDVVERHVHPRLNVIPASCPLQAICTNFPRCLDVGSCQGFKDERVSC